MDGEPKKELPNTLSRLEVLINTVNPSNKLYRLKGAVHFYDDAVRPIEFNHRNHMEIGVTSMFSHFSSRQKLVGKTNFLFAA